MARAGRTVVTGITMVAALTACGLFDDKSPSPISPEDLRGAEINYLSFTDGLEEQVTRDLITKFETETGARVNLSLVRPEEIGAIIEQRAAEGQPPHVARVLSVSPHRQRLSDLRPYLHDSTLPDSFLPNIKAAITGRDGEMLAAPSDLTVNGPLINVDLFRKAGVELPTADTSWTWDELVARAVEVQRANNTPHAIALDTTGHRLSGLINQWGTAPFDAEGRPGLDVAKATKAFEELARLHREGVMPTSLWLGDPLYPDAKSMFIAQDVPVLFSGNWVISQLNTAAKFRWQAVPNPHVERSAGFPGGKYLVAFRESDNPAAAAAFIEWMTSQDHQQEYVSRSLFMPTRKDLVGRVRYPQRHEDMAVFSRAIGQIGPSEFASNASPAFSQLSGVIIAQFVAVLRAERTPAEAAATIRSESERLYRETSH